MNMLAVADGRPETMGIVPIIRHHVNFSMNWLPENIRPLLAKERQKKEIQEGLIKACDVIDPIIGILRGSKDMKMAKACLVEGLPKASALSRKCQKETPKTAFYRTTGNCHLGNAFV